MKRPLPSPAELLLAREWLRAGCPLSDDAVEAHRVLTVLIDALPSHMPRYCYGSPEWKAAGGWGDEPSADMVLGCGGDCPDCGFVPCERHR